MSVLFFRKISITFESSFPYGTVFSKYQKKFNELEVSTKYNDTGRKRQQHCLIKLRPAREKGKKARKVSKNYGQSKCISHT